LTRLALPNREPAVELVNGQPQFETSPPGIVADFEITNMHGIGQPMMMMCWDMRSKAGS